MTTPPVEESIIQLPLNQAKAMVVTWALSLAYAQFSGKVQMQIVSIEQTQLALSRLGYGGFKALLEDLNRLTEAAFPGIPTAELSDVAAGQCAHCSCDPGDVCCWCGAVIPASLT